MNNFDLKTLNIKCRKTIRYVIILIIQINDKVPLSMSKVMPRSSAELNEAVDNITWLLTKAVQRKDGKLWSVEIEKLRLCARRAWNKAIRTSLDADWDAYKAAQKAFRKSVRQRAKEAWKRFCAEMEYIPDYARIHRILAKDSRLLPSSLRRPSGSFTESGCSDDKTEARPPDIFLPSEEDWSLASRIVTMERIRWAIGKFKPYKSAGDDGIFPALLKESGEILLRPLCGVLRSSLALGHIPTKWEKVKVTFIPKPGKPSHFAANDF